MTVSSPGATDAPPSAQVDVIIPVHDATRPVARAIASLGRDSSTTSMTVTVVCHNVSASAIRDALGPQHDERVRLLEFADGRGSPAGPRNHGLSQSTAEFVCFLDSDDYLQPGAIDAWVDLATRRSLDVVIAPEMHDTGRVVRTPPTRPFRTAPLDGVRDRLSYRTAVRGVIRRSTMVDHDVRYSEGHPTGEDQIVTTMLSFAGVRVGFPRRSPAYVISNDAETRVTQTPRPLTAEFASVRALLTHPFVAGLDARGRRSIVCRVVRVQLFGAVSARSTVSDWHPDDRAEIVALLDLCDEVGTDWERSFSLADRRLLDALRRVDSPERAVIDLARRRRHFARPASLVTRDLSAVFSREAPLRVIAASALVSVR